MIKFIAIDENSGLIRADNLLGDYAGINNPQQFAEAVAADLNLFQIRGADLAVLSRDSSDIDYRETRVFIRHHADGYWRMSVQKEHSGRSG